MNVSVCDDERGMEERKYFGSDGEEIESSHIDEGISDISRIGSLEGVSILNLHSNKLSSLLGLPRLPMLTDLNLSSNLFSDSDIEGLSNLPNLRILDLSGNNLRTLTGLPYMPFLNHFIAAFNRIDTLDGIDGLPAVAVIDLRGNLLRSPSSFAGLETLSNLKELTLAGPDGRNANPVCAQADAIIEIFDTYCYFGTIGSLSRKDWASPPGLGHGRDAKLTATSFAAVAAAATAASKSPHARRLPDITPKFDAVVQKFLSRARGRGSATLVSAPDWSVGDKEEDVDVEVGTGSGAMFKYPSEEGDDNISEITTDDLEGPRRSEMQTRARDMSHRYGQGDSLRGVRTRGSEGAGAPPSRSSQKPPSSASSSNPWVAKPLKGTSPSVVSPARLPLKTGTRQSQGGISSAAPTGCGPSDTCPPSPHSPPPPEQGTGDTLRLEMVERGTQVEEPSHQHDSLPSPSLSSQLSGMQRQLSIMQFASKMGHMEVTSAHKRAMVTCLFDIWKAHTVGCSLSEQKEQLLQENSLLRLTSERASKSAEATRSAASIEVEQLKRALAEEKVRSEAVRRQLVKQEASVQSLRKELVQAKSMYKDLEESLTAKCDAERDGAEARLAAVKHKCEVEVTDLRRKLSEVTQQNQENESLSQHLQGQVQSLCDEVKRLQGQSCETCAAQRARAVEMEGHLRGLRRENDALQQRVDAAERAQSKEIALEEKCCRLEASVEESRRQLEGWKQKYEAASKSLAEEVGEKKKLEKQLNKVATGYATLRSENVRLKDDMDMVSEENESNKTKVSELRRITQELKDVLRQVSDRCRLLESRQSEGKGDGGDKGGAGSSGLHAQLQSALEQVELLRRDREEVDRALLEAEGRYAAEMSDLLEAQKDLELSVRVKEKLIDDQNASIRRLKDRQREDEERLQVAMRHLEEEVEEMREEVSELERQLEASREDEKIALGRVQELESAQEEAEEELRAAWREEVQQLTSRLSSRDGDIEYVPQRQRSAESACDVYKQHVCAGPSLPRSCCLWDVCTFGWIIYIDGWVACVYIH